MGNRGSRVGPASAVAAASDGGGAGKADRAAAVAVASELPRRKGSRHAVAAAPAAAVANHATATAPVSPEDVRTQVVAVLAGTLDTGAAPATATSGVPRFAREAMWHAATFRRMATTAIVLGPTRATHRQFHSAETDTSAAAAAATIADFIGGLGSGEGGGCAVLAVLGGCGAGKSTAIAAGVCKAAAASASASRQPALLLRRVGATPDACDPERLARVLCAEAGVIVPVSAHDRVVCRDSAAVALARVLAAGTEDRPVVMVLDGIDELTDAGAATLGWLLPALAHGNPFARVVLSAREGGAAEIALRRSAFGIRFIHISTLEGESDDGDGSGGSGDSQAMAALLAILGPKQTAKLPAGVGQGLVKAFTIADREFGGSSALHVRLLADMVVHGIIPGKTEDIDDGCFYATVEECVAACMDAMEAAAGPVGQRILAAITAANGPVSAGELTDASSATAATLATISKVAGGFLLLDGPPESPNAWFSWRHETARAVAWQRYFGVRASSSRLARSGGPDLERLLLRRAPRRPQFGVSSGSPAARKRHPSATSIVSRASTAMSGASVPNGSLDGGLVNLAETCTELARAFKKVPGRTAAVVRALATAAAWDDVVAFVKDCAETAKTLAKDFESVDEVVVTMRQAALLAEAAVLDLETKDEVSEGDTEDGELWTHFNASGLGKVAVSNYGRRVAVSTKSELLVFDAWTGRALAAVRPGQTEDSSENSLQENHHETMQRGTEPAGWAACGLGFLSHRGLIASRRGGEAWWWRPPASQQRGRSRTARSRSRGALSDARELAGWARVPTASGVSAPAAEWVVGSESVIGRPRSTRQASAAWGVSHLSANELGGYANDGARMQVVTASTPRPSGWFIVAPDSSSVVWAVDGEAVQQQQQHPLHDNGPWVRHEAASHAVVCFDLPLAAPRERTRRQQRIRDGQEADVDAATAQPARLARRWRHDGLGGVAWAGFGAAGARVVVASGDRGGVLTCVGAASGRAQWRVDVLTSAALPARDRVAAVALVGSDDNDEALVAVTAKGWMVGVVQGCAVTRARLALLPGEAVVGAVGLAASALGAFGPRAIVATDLGRVLVTGVRELVEIAPRPAEGLLGVTLATAAAWDRLQAAKTSEVRFLDRGPRVDWKGKVLDVAVLQIAVVVVNDNSPASWSTMCLTEDGTLEVVLERGSGSRQVKTALDGIAARTGAKPKFSFISAQAGSFVSVTSNGTVTLVSDAGAETLAGNTHDGDVVGLATIPHPGESAPDIVVLRQGSLYIWDSSLRRPWRCVRLLPDAGSSRATGSDRALLAPVLSNGARRLVVVMENATMAVTRVDTYRRQRDELNGPILTDDEATPEDPSVEESDTRKNTASDEFEAEARLASIYGTKDRPLERPTAVSARSSAVDAAEDDDGKIDLAVGDAAGALRIFRLTSKAGQAGGWSVALVSERPPSPAVHAGSALVLVQWYVDGGWTDTDGPGQDVMSGSAPAVLSAADEGENQDRRCLPRLVTVDASGIVAVWEREVASAASSSRLPVPALADAKVEAAAGRLRLLRRLDAGCPVSCAALVPPVAVGSTGPREAEVVCGGLDGRFKLVQLGEL
ncbi:hypothetical protein HK405_000460 [Cladochytrium tenue]|nr:hypothetical protein HK405_000460 [Cladochytrium tenue]